MIQRRFLLRLSGLFLFVRLFPSWARVRNNCVFGAIRWDAQYCNIPGEPCFEEGKSLGDPKWRFRAPIETKFSSDDRAIFTATQSSFDKEIKVAYESKIKFWTYLLYGEAGSVNVSHSMMKGLYFHRNSKIKNKVNYSVMATLDTLGYKEKYDKSVEKILEFLRDSNYQRVFYDRPVIFIFYIDELLEKYWGGDLVNLSVALNYLRQGSINEGLGNPYFVLMVSPPQKAENLRVSLGLDAISAYAIAPPPDVNDTYSVLATKVRAYWESEASNTSGGLVPTVMIGWDTRPRKEHPPAYDRRNRLAKDMAAHITPPTPVEFSQECEAAIKFIESHQGQCSSRLVIIYAWNENSEGGALEPTLGDPNATNLRAATKVME